ncbi:MAG: polysaccharide deacetylase family protein [Chloroflexi bacterium]|nr:MAG: polysaccharide deacetylase family protein [Chloroflexota bacterium]
MAMRKTIALIGLYLWAISSSIAAPYENLSIDFPREMGDGTLRRISVPILMYHYVSELPPDADDIRIENTLAPQLFEEHIAYLVENGYVSVSLYEIHDALMNGSRLPDKPVVLTFDDGYRDHYEIVFPILQQYGFTGTFFIITSRADNHDPNHLSWAQIEEMAAAGMSMESHTKDHLDMRNRDYDFLVYETLGSIESLAAHTGQEPRFLAYPAGRYDESTLAFLEQTDLWRAVTTQFGASHTSDNFFEMSRLRVTHNTGVAGLIYLLENGG